MNELPAITGSSYHTAAVNLAAVGGGWDGAAQGAAGGTWEDLSAKDKFVNALYRPAQTTISKQEIVAMPTRRLVQVFIADPNENLSLDDSLLYSGDQKLTDATDQELFFEIDINMILKAHNAKRVKVIDKKVKERTEYLEAAKIRDLKMVVVTVAGF